MAVAAFKSFRLGIISNSFTTGLVYDVEKQGGDTNLTVSTGLFIPANSLLFGVSIIILKPFLGTGLEALRLFIEGGEPTLPNPGGLTDIQVGTLSNFSTQSQFTLNGGELKFLIATLGGGLNAFTQGIAKFSLTYYRTF